MLADKLKFSNSFSKEDFSLALCGVDLICDLQVYQGIHDASFHKDVVDKSLSDRMRHYALHYAKYSGELVGEKNLSKEKFERIFVDTIIISMAALNALGVRYSSVYFDEKSGFDEGKKIDFGGQYLLSMARLAKVCESYEHGEDLLYEELYKELITEILSICVLFSFCFNININAAVTSRWGEIESR